MSTQPDIGSWTRPASRHRRSQTSDGPAQFITPISKPKKRKAGQKELVLDEGLGLSTEAQQYREIRSSQLRNRVDEWRAIPNPEHWQVSPETRRLLEHWRKHAFNSYRPFFCQIEAVETAIWLIEVAPNEKSGKAFLDHLANANNDANPELARLALKLATGAGKTTVMAMLIAAQATPRARSSRGP